MITLILMLLCFHRTVLYLYTALCFALNLFLYACLHACFSYVYSTRKTSRFLFRGESVGLSFQRTISRKFGIASFKYIFCSARFGNDCQHYRGSHVAYAASAELGDFHGQAMVLAAAMTRWRKSEYKQGNTSVFKEV